MQKICRCKKVMGSTILISTFLLCVPLPPAQAGMITTEYAIHQDSKKRSDRARVSAFVERAEVIAQMRAYGTHHKEALARVDSLTDSEIASIAGRMDQIPVGAAGTYSLNGGFLSIIGLALYAIVAAIVIYFGFSDEKKEKS